MVNTDNMNSAVINQKLAQRLEKEYPNVSIDTNIRLTHLQSWILPKSNTELHDSINLWLNEIKSSPDYQELYDRYFESKTKQKGNKSR